MIYFDRITIGPKVMSGKSCIRDTRITVSLVLNLLSNNNSFDAMLLDYPELEKEDILTLLKYAEWSTSESTLMVEQ